MFPGPWEIVTGDQVTRTHTVPVEIEADELAGTKGRMSVAMSTDVSGRLDHHLDEASSVIQRHSPPREIREDDEVVVGWVLEQKGVQSGGQGVVGGVEFALCFMHRANPSRKAVPDKRRDSLTNDQQS